jgi:hypothetical protein
MKKCGNEKVFQFIFDQWSQAIADLDRNSAYFPHRAFLYVVPNVENS